MTELKNMFRVGDVVWVKYPYERNTQTPVRIMGCYYNSVLVYSKKHHCSWTTTRDEIISKNA